MSSKAEDPSLYIYVFTNRTQDNARKTPIEVEVWKWSKLNNELKIEVKR